MDEFFTVLRKYAAFGGRASRKEYWTFSLVSLAVFILLWIAARTTDSAALLMLMVLYAFVVLVPSVAVTVRRLHDTGRSGWWYWLAIVPLVGPITLIVFFCQDGRPGVNAYGPNPKGV